MEMWYNKVVAGVQPDHLYNCHLFGENMKKYEISQDSESPDGPVALQVQHLSFKDEPFSNPTVKAELWREWIRSKYNRFKKYYFKTEI